PRRAAIAAADVAGGCRRGMTPSARAAAAERCPVTVVLAVVCADGVVMGADTQITDMARGASYPGRRLHRLGEAAAWGGSGARAVQVDLQRAFEHSAGAILDAEDVGRALQEQMLPILRHHYDNFIAEVPGEDLP